MSQQTKTTRESRALVPIHGSDGRQTVAAAPGERVVDLPADCIPRVAVADWQPVGDGTYRPVARIHGCWPRLNEVHELQLGIRYRTLKRLIIAGFLEGARVSPSCWIFSLESYWDHMKRCQENPEFWDDAKNKQAYNKAIGE
ncbi:hypothetical protein [Cerasicoccus maritimus]|uniref:hypothetical protein n=1 Tax=Cerasicoccus maritimus TaxID=490089 RepID=UPI0028526906|nr:hypothetical protein [Cerasicoccus maritimus]